MADGATVNIDGLRKLQRALTDLPERVAKKALGSAVLAGGGVVRKDARRRAPVATGNLRKQIRTRRSKLSTVYNVTYFVGVGGKAFYWRFIEFGTKDQPAHPFLRPAFEENKKAAIEAIKAKLSIAIEREAAKLAR